MSYELKNNIINYDTTMMWLGGGNDADYREYFDSLHYSNVGDFAEVLDLINDGYIDDAIILNNEIVAESDIYANLQTVLDIYLNTWCKERYELFYSEYSTLFEIAEQTPNEAGDAVFIARIMLDYEVDETTTPYFAEKEKNTISNNFEFKLYPNPAADKITLEYSSTDDFDEIGIKEAKFKIYTITGKLVYSKEFKTEFFAEEFSVDELINGVYLYKIKLKYAKSNDSLDKSGKLVILNN